MKAIFIYVEGGGDSNHGKRELRLGFNALFKEQKRVAQGKFLWQLIPCGSRNKTFQRFQNHLQQAGHESLLVLLVDSEDAIAVEKRDAAEDNAKVRVQHLTQRDHWDLSGADPKQVHLMVQCMEAWIVADREALSAFYGQRFHAQSLPNRKNLEEEPKAHLLEKLKKATRKTQKGEYAKIEHASKLLERIDPVKVGKRCSGFLIFTTWLAQEIARV